MTKPIHSTVSINIARTYDITAPKHEAYLEVRPYVGHKAIIELLAFNFSHALTIVGGINARILINEWKQDEGEYNGQVIPAAVKIISGHHECGKNKGCEKP
jgi:hypothetical protein